MQLSYAALALVHCSLICSVAVAHVQDLSLALLQAMQAGNHMQLGVNTQGCLSKAANMAVCYSGFI